jgi:acid stress-induced BolA-like protein IbaG/YrbA
MEPDEIRRLIEAGMPGSEVQVSGDGRHFEAIVVSEAFEGLSMIKQHRLVYDTLGDRFATEVLHALSLRTYTPERWARMSPTA